MSVFVDGGVLFSAANGSDGRHERAAEILRDIATRTTMTTDHVVVDTWNALERRFGHANAMRFWHSLRHTPLRVEAVTAPDLERALAIAETWPDHEFHPVNCTSFAAMERLGLREAASFDPRFAVYRFGPDRREAFRIIR